MLQKGAIIEVPPEKQTFVSPFFAVPKAGSDKIRPIIDLRALNEHLHYEHFKMESLRTVKDLILEDDYLVKLDLKDAYFAVPVHPDHQRFLQFRWQGRIYQFTCLPFGLASAPRVFTKTLHPVLTVLRSLGIRLVAYLDDLLLMARSRTAALQHLATLLHLLLSLGFSVNWKKSHLVPTRELTFLGITINASSMEFTLPEDKAVKLESQCQQLLTRSSVTLREVASVVGRMVSTAVAILPAPLHYHSLQATKSIHLRRGATYSRQIQLTEQCKQELRWWTRHLRQWNGRPVRIADPDLVIQSDASSAGRSGWGACCGPVTTGGRWTSQDKQLHINVLELLAALYALRSLVPRLRRGTVLLQLDNEVAVACIRRMGSNTSGSLNAIAQQIWEWCLARQIMLIPEYLPGVSNSVADYHSRHHNDSSDWMLDRSTFQNIERIWHVDCDLFASRTNAQLPSYVSWRPDPYALCANAFSLDWSSSHGYAFPPICLIGKCLSRVMQQKVPSLVLVTPLWQGQAWFPVILQLASDVPRVLPRLPNLLTGPDGEIHPLVEEAKLTLVVWKLSGINSVTEEFRRHLQNYSWPHGAQGQGRFTSRHGTSGVIGVANGVSIPWMPL